MTKTRTPLRGILATIVLILSGGPLLAQSAEADAYLYGPSAGSLVIAGGGGLHDTGIIERFLELAGGASAPIVVIPTADGQTSYDLDWSGLQIFRDAGATNVTLLHTYDPAEADTEAFVEPLRGARGVWFVGGRQWRLADAYLDTRTQHELQAVLARGGTIGGSSAGASIQASFLVRGAKEGNHIVMSPEYERGFGFLRNTAIDQHLIVRQRERDLLEVLGVRPELLGIGIDEGTAIVVQGDTFEVIGASRVAIYDGTPASAAMGYHFLDAGDRYDMREREALPTWSAALLPAFDRGSREHGDSGTSATTATRS